MRNLRNIFKEYQGDKRVYRNLLIGFASLIVLGVLLLFVVSPEFRHSIGIGNNTPVAIPKEHPKPHHKGGQTPGHQKGTPQGVHKHRKQNGTQGNAHPGSTKVVKHPSNGNTPSGSGGGNTPSGEPNPEGSNPTPSNPPPVNQPTPSAPPNGGGGGGATNPGGASGSSGGTPNPPPPPSNGAGSTGVRVEAGGGKVEAEVNIPPVTNLPPVEEVTKGVNETVNGATGIVEETVNGVTGPLGIEAELPKICLINCH